MAAALSPEQEQEICCGMYSSAAYYHSFLMLLFTKTLQIRQRLQHLLNETDCNSDKVIVAAILTSFFAFILFFNLSASQYILTLVFTMIAVALTYYSHGFGPLCHQQLSTNNLNMKNEPSCFEQCYIPENIKKIWSKIPSICIVESWVYYTILASVILLFLTLSLSSMKLLFVICFSALITMLALKVYKLGPLANPNFVSNTVL